MLCRSGMEKSGKNQQGGQKISVSGRWAKWAMDDTGNLLTHLFADASLSGGPLHVPGEGGRRRWGAHRDSTPGETRVRTSEKRLVSIRLNALRPSRYGRKTSSIYDARSLGF